MKIYILLILKKGVGIMIKDEIAVVKQAILNELEGYEFYKMAAKHADSEEIKKNFEILAEDEFNHSEWLKKYYSYESKNQFASFALKRADEAETMHIFDGIDVSNEYITSLLSVLKIAVQIEKASVEFYKKAFDEAMEPNLKKLYEKLILFEEGHLMMFEEQYYKLKHEWWENQDY